MNWVKLVKRINISIGLMLFVWVICYYELRDVSMATLSWGINSGLYLAIPILYLLLEKNIKQKELKKILLWNSIIMSGIYASYIASSMEDTSGFVSVFSVLLAATLLGLIYYFVNFFFFIKESTNNIIDNQNDHDENKAESLKDTAKKMTSAKNNNKSNKKSTSIDKKYSDLNKLKKLLDKDIITKEEFEKEKKKILK